MIVNGKQYEIHWAHANFQKRQSNSEAKNIRPDSNSANITNGSDVAPLQHQYSVAISGDDCFQHMNFDLKKQR